MTKRMNCAEALAEAVSLSMKRDPDTMLIWGSFFSISGYRHLANRFQEEFPTRIAYPPTSELANCGIAIGAAMAGARAIVPVGAASFVFRAWDQIQHEAAVAHYMSNGTVKVPVVFYMLHGIRGGGGPQHSQSPQAMFWNCPGLEIVMPSTPADVKGLFLASVRSDNPTVFLHHPRLLELEGEVPEGDDEVPLGRAVVRRQGGDITLAAISYEVHTALVAAEILKEEGIEAEVVDLRTLSPLDERTLFESVNKTGRLIAIDDCPPHCSTASEIAALVAGNCFEKLRAPVACVTRADAPVPFSPILEAEVAPSAQKIVETARRLIGSSSKRL